MPQAPDANAGAPESDVDVIHVLDPARHNMEVRNSTHDEELWQAGWTVEHVRDGTPTGHWRLAEGYKLSEQRGVVTSCDPLYRANCSGGSIALPPNCEFVAVKIRGELRIGLKLTAAVNVGDQLLLPNYLLRN